MQAGEDHQDAEPFVPSEAVVGAGGDERGLALFDRDRLALHGQDAATLDHDVELVVLMRLLTVGLGRDEHVDADLEARRAVHDLIAAIRGLQPPPRRLDVERLHAAEPSGREVAYACRGAEFVDETFRLSSVAGIRIGVNWSWLVVFALIAWTLAESVLPDQNPGLSVANRCRRSARTKSWSMRSRSSATAGSAVRSSSTATGSWGCSR
jgi:hypothetical protein